ncbi:MAG: hypothetical protein HYX92_05625 [Chloroflexi bacterium]|nr:hypothetical protein [Chloroflexota bacterium]
MATWLYQVTTECADPSREEEFADWYDHVHFPDLLKAPGFKSAVRYVIKEGLPPRDGIWAEGQGKYLATYEIETDDIEKTWAEAQQYLKSVRAAGRVSPLCKVISRSLWQQVNP